jgi:hypothetical protein
MSEQKGILIRDPNESNTLLGWFIRYMIWKAEIVYRPKMRIMYLNNCRGVLCAKESVHLFVFYCFFIAARAIFQPLVCDQYCKFRLRLLAVHMRICLHATPTATWYLVSHPKDLPPRPTALFETSGARGIKRLNEPSLLKAIGAKNR